MKLLIGLAVLIVVIALVALCLWNSQKQWVNEGTTTSEKDSLTFTLTYKTTLRNHLFHPFVTATILHFQTTSPKSHSSFHTVLPNVALEESQKQVEFHSSRDGLSLRFKGAEICFVSHDGSD